MIADEMMLVTDAVYSPETRVTGYCAYVEYWEGDEPSQKMITSSTFRETTKNQQEAEARAVLKGLNKINTMTGVEEIRLLKIYCDSPEVVAGVAAPSSLEYNHYLAGPVEGILERLEDIKSNFGNPTIEFKILPNRNGSWEYPSLLHSKCSENAFIKATQAR